MRKKKSKQDIVLHIIDVFLLGICAFIVLFVVSFAIVEVADPETLPIADSVSFGICDEELSPVIAETNDGWYYNKFRFNKNLQKIEVIEDENWITIILIPNCDPYNYRPRNSAEESV